MRPLQKYLPLATSVILMYVVLLLIYPHFQYFIDPDGTAYLTISRRYAAGDYEKAINGYWSPWSCWLTALLMKKGIAAIPASVIINALGATGLLYITQSLLLRFKTTVQLQWPLMLSLSVFLCYAVFWQSFDDLWECFFLLTTLRLILYPQFSQKTAMWLSTGAIGALAYFSKAYSFPFFILNTICCVYFVTEKNKKQWIKICAISIGAMILFSLPWIFLLHNKYGIWTTSTAGPLNTSWYLVGHPYWKEGIEHILPPVYSDSPYYWEDPYIVNGITPHFWSSWHLMGLQLLRVGLNSLKLIASMLQLSIFFPLVALLSFYSWFKKPDRDRYSTDLKVITLSFLLFPLGYILINFESRYLWYMLPLAMIIGSYIITDNPFLAKRKVNMNLFYWLFALSFTVFPIRTMLIQYHTGKDEATLATKLNASGIKGSFTSNAHPGAQMQSTIRLAYLSGNSYYIVPLPDSLSDNDIITNARQYNVKYYLRYNTRKSNRNYNSNLPVLMTEPSGVWTIYDLGKTSDY